MKTPLKLLLVLTAAIAFKSSMASYEVGPIQLLNLSAEGGTSGIIYNEDAVKQLFLNPELKDREAVVISIIGAFRKGKSFLLNYILRYLYAKYPSLSSKQLINPENWLGDENESLKGFAWKSGTERVTKGLIFWGDVFLFDARNGDKFAIYVMDTQGLFDHKTTSADNSRIFSLSTLISSVQILNLINVIQEDELEYLQFATEYARFAAIDSEETPFQNLLFLLRDWNSPDEYNYGLRGGKAYLDGILEIHDYQSPALKSVRKYLKSSFDRLDCFLMPHPGRKVAVDRSYDGSWKHIESDFVTMMNELFEFLFRKMKPKTINGNPVKSDELLIFINTYINNFNNDSLPEATSVFGAVLENQFKILVAKSIDTYIETVSKYDSQINNEQDIDNLHKSAKKMALKHFDNERKFGTYSEAQEYKRDLTNKIEDAFKQWKSVSMAHLKTLREYQAKTNEQIQKVKQAQIEDERARAELARAESEANEARIALQKAKTDTEQARKDVENLRIKLEEANSMREEANAKEQATRDWLDKMKSDKEFYEQEYNKMRSQANSDVGNSLSESQGQSGFLGMIGSVVRVVSVVASIVSIFG